MMTDVTNNGITEKGKENKEKRHIREKTASRERDRDTQRERKEVVQLG